MFSLIAACNNAKIFLSKKATEGVSAFLKIFDELETLLAASTNECAQSGDKPQASLSLFVDKLVASSGLAEYHGSQDEIAGTQRVANLQELSNSAALYPLSREGLLDFLDHIELDRSLEIENEENAGDAVTLITLHNTKGLEFANVVITGLEKGIFPRHDKTGEELEEERRLFYVGITRARDSLYMTTCSQRRLFGKLEFMEPSPFLHEIDRSLLSIAGLVPRGFFSGQSDGGDETHPLASKWRIGAIIEHDDYGYGKIISAETKEGELVITVRFESGGVKTFLPEYQKHALTRVK
jgi:DNA helicase-2/ATP-dependent DNA helicase PcrA